MRMHDSSRGVGLFFAVMTAITVLTVFFLQGCAVNPVQQAETLEQKAYATYGTFVIFQERGAALVKDPAVPESAKRAISQAAVEAKMVVDPMVETAQLAADIREAVEAGTTDGEKLLIVNYNLADWLGKATTEVNELAAAVKEIRK